MARMASPVRGPAPCPARVTGRSAAMTTRPQEAGPALTIPRRPTPRLLGTPHPLTTPRPLGTPHPLTTPRLLGTPPPLPTPRPLGTPHPLTTPRLLGTPHPLTTPRPLTNPRPLATAPLPLRTALRTRAQRRAGAAPCLTP